MILPAIGSALPTFQTSRPDPVGGVGAPALASQGAGADFGAVLAKVSTDAVATIKGAETASIAGIKGEASTQAVVDAVMGAERALQTAVVVRDKVVAAYQEISRMAI
ncbi:flagellar hook-basal body complex protein FliE [Aureimonas endophytica]|uniref:Flagellar hook-basal body complex protein FliE n=1 Tax=Aureimonas endophytica TaxID=2027858 RepID=A0A917A2L2_9HYPH|nr:flagellar hook-basal body complex protein FliE [Aureimonas endophytica]GGE23789.1 flagellar hook-basal body complex protein FliE [Aureimonas endophytica]